MIHRIFSYALIAVFGALLPVSAVDAQSAAPTPVPRNAPDFAPMSFLLGTWTCHQQLRGKDRPDTSTTSVGMDGMYMITQDVAPPFDQYRSFTIHGTNYMTYDTTIKKWVQVGVDSAGAYGISSSTGWQGNTIVWSSTGLDGSTSTDTVTKNSSTDTTDVSVNRDASGKTTTSTIHCAKTA